MNFALDPNEFACIVQFLLVLMHSVRDPYGLACVLHGFLWIYMHVVGDPYGFARVLLGFHMHAHAVC